LFKGIAFSFFIPLPHKIHEERDLYEFLLNREAEDDLVILNAQFWRGKKYFFNSVIFI
jgi:hypothetical protein